MLVCAMRRSSHFRIVAVVLAAIAFDMIVASPAQPAEIPAIASRQRAEKKSFTDSEITDGFFKTAFGAEFHLAGRVDRIRKYDVPVRVFAEGLNRPDRKAQLAKVVADIGQRVQHLDIAMADTSDGANVVVKLVRDRDLFRTITAFYGERARPRDPLLARSAMPVRLSQERQVRDRALRRDPHRRQRRFRLPRLRL